jgi:hypothetical protein
VKDFINRPLLWRTREEWGGGAAKVGRFDRQIAPFCGEAFRGTAKFATGRFIGN